MAAALEPGQLDELRERLERDRGALLADIDRLQNEDVSAESQYDSEFSGYGNHMAETGTEIFEQERSLAIEGALRTQLEDVERALSRFEAGTYGICENCGKPIGYERLAARPQATLCINCQARRESQRR